MTHPFPSQANLRKTNHNCVGIVNHIQPNPSVSQTLEELDFDRGIWACAMYGDYDALAKHIKKGHVNDRDANGYTALHYAIRTGYTRSVTMLLEAGADVNAQTNGGATPLHRAALWGHTEILKMLLSIRGIRIDVKNEDGQNPLHRAAEGNHIEACRLLLAADKQLKYDRDVQGRLPFDLADDDNTELLQLLVVDLPAGYI
ncbi:ankyrin repeat domain-containing protein 39 [Culicoides brevitarsis]|uniref:ankyrin repeat domain-containing protein 39 n=1 Tax=Culicoides brevitarsis TaxID=469753 RepID=UPI00307BF080